MGGSGPGNPLEALMASFLAQNGGGAAEAMAIPLSVSIGPGMLVWHVYACGVSVLLHHVQSTCNDNPPRMHTYLHFNSQLNTPPPPKSDGMSVTPMGQPVTATINASGGPPGPTSRGGPPMGFGTSQQHPSDIQMQGMRIGSMLGRQLYDIATSRGLVPERGGRGRSRGPPGGHSDRGTRVAGRHVFRSTHAFSTLRTVLDGMGTAADVAEGIEVHPGQTEAEAFQQPAQASEFIRQLPPLYHPPSEEFGMCTCIYGSMCTRTYGSMCTRTYGRMCTRTYGRMCTRTMEVCVHVHMEVCVHVHMEYEKMYINKGGGCHMDCWRKGVLIGVVPHTQYTVYIHSIHTQYTYLWYTYTVHINNTHTYSTHTTESHSLSHTPQSHCISHTPQSHCISHPTQSHCISHTTQSHCKSHTTQSHCISHTTQSHCISHTPQ